MSVWPEKEAFNKSKANQIGLQDREVPVGKAINQNLIDEVGDNSVHEIRTSRHGCILSLPNQREKNRTQKINSEREN